MNERLWHPLTGALLITAISLALAPLAGLSALGRTGLAVAAFFALGATAGFAVSGST